MLGDPLPKQHQLGKGMAYVLNHWESLTNYLKEGCLESIIIKLKT